ncbi:MAG: CDGSH iron-sulfur domain-containing protein [Catenulispora sp.]|nr:CDGSH iron-sulfur domain-containing protein [Catenulispora sp.]
MPQGKGPILVRGPVTVRLPDGTVVHSERPTVALCTCWLSERYPFCDTSHRRHVRPPQDSGPSHHESSHEPSHESSHGSSR